MLPFASSSTEHSISRTGAIHRSINIFLSKRNANLQQASNSSAVRAFDTPTDEPMLAGLTKTSGEPTAPTASSYVIGDDPDIATKGTIGNPASRISRLATSL